MRCGTYSMRLQIFRGEVSQALGLGSPGSPGARFRVLKDGSRELKREKKVLQAFPFPPLAFRIEGGSARLTEGGSTLTITLSRLGCSIPKTPLSESEGVGGWSDAGNYGGKQKVDHLAPGERKGKRIRCISNLARLDIRITWRMRWEVGEVASQ